MRPCAATCTTSASGTRPACRTTPCLHVEHDLWPLILGNRVTVGHSVTLHGCVIEDECLIGIGAMVLNGARVGTGSIVAAGALVPEGMQVPPHSMVMGVPGKVRRQVTEAELERIREGSAELRSIPPNLQGRSHLIRAVKGTRDLLPPATEVWNHVEEAARRVFRAYNYHEIRTPILEETQLVRARRRRRNRHRHQGDVHLRGPRRQFADAASRSHRVRDPRLHRAPAGPAAGRAEALLHGARCSAASARRRAATASSSRSARRPSARNRRAVDAEVIEMVVELLRAVGPRRISAAAQFGGLPEVPPALRRAAARGTGRRGAGACATIASAAPYTNPLRVLDCKVEADQPIIDALPSILDHLCEACRAHFDAVQQLPARPRHRVRNPAAPGARPGLLHAHDLRGGARRARRAELRAGRRPLRRAGRGAGLEGPLARHRLLDRRGPPGDEPWRRRAAGVDRSDLFIAPLGEPRLRHAALLARDLRRRGVSVELAADGKLKRAMELANKLGARYALIVGEDEIAAGQVHFEEHGDRRAAKASASEELRRERLVHGMHELRTSRFSRRPAPHAHLRPAARLRRGHARRC